MLNRAVCLLAGLGLLIGCEQASEPKVTDVKKKKAVAEFGLPPPIYFVPPKATAVPLDGVLRVPFRQGEVFPGAPVRALETAFDYLTFRVGGNQWVVQPTPGPEGLEVAVAVGARRGGSLLGFSTVPRRIEIATPDGGSRRVLFQEHTKLCLYVRHGTWEKPAPSAAVAHRFGFPLEFAPVSDPLPILPGGELPVRLRYGLGVEGVEVVADQIPQGGSGKAVEMFRGKTGPGGQLMIPVTRAGVWRLTAVYEVAGVDGEPDQVHRTTMVFRTGEE